MYMYLNYTNTSIRYRSTIHTVLDTWPHTNTRTQSIEYKYTLTLVHTRVHTQI